MAVLETLLARIGSSINDFTGLDPEFPPRLDALAGKRLRVDIDGFAAGLDVAVERRRFHLAPAGGEQPDVTVSGAPFALLGLLRAADPREALQGANVYIQGDMRVAQRFATLFGQLDIDWEELLAEKIGDIPAHQAGGWVRRFLSWRRRAHTAWASAVTEYLQEEARHLPTRVEIEDFLDQVDVMRERADRAEAKLAILEKQLRKAPG